jgi:CheY-like chemotaxis protein
MKKVLIVEDVAFNLDLLVQLLEDEYQLITAGDGEKGVALAKSDHPDLILMDMSLPIIDGWEATRRIKSDEASKQIPVIGLSAHAMGGDKDKALAAGCDAYLTKPIDDDLLLATLHKFLES